MRDTSLEAYRAIQVSGYVSEVRRRAYGVLYHHGPLAQFEMEAYETQGKHYGGNIIKRVCELERMGLVREVGRRVNPASGRECIVWDATSNMPRPLPPKGRTDVVAQLHRENQALREEIHELRRSRHSLPLFRRAVQSTPPYPRSQRDKDW